MAHPKRILQMLLDQMQRLLSTTDWDPDGVREGQRSYVVKSPDATEGVLIVNETAFLNTGKRSGRS